MSDQMELDLTPQQHIWMQKAQAFHGDNPHVYDMLIDYVRQAKAAGFDRIGIELVWNRMRWDWLLRTREDGTGYKLNQNYKAFYARLIMAQEPELDGIFETRKLRS